MLRLQRVSDSRSGSRSRMRTQQKPPDFLTRNKKAVRDGSKAETAKKDNRKGEQQSKAVVHPPRYRQPAAAGEGQVVITQTQLDQLLRMSFVAGQERGTESKSEKMSDRASHVVLEASQVPGLAEEYSIPAAKQAKAREMVEHRAEPVVVQSRPRQPPVAMSRELNQQEQWLRDLEEQAAERKRKREEENARKRETVVEDYNPWGRPGCGAPIRSQSGQLLTDYRTRQRVSEDPQGRRGGDYVQQSRVSASPEKVAFPHVNASPQRVTAVEGYAQPSLQSLTNQLSPPAAQSHVSTSGGLYSNTPQFARGAGPFVDQYVLQDRAEKRKQQLEHVEFLREQVAAKERLKLEEKLLHEREEKEEENRIARERERIRRQNEQEAERARRKEAETKQYNLALKRRREKAEENARTTKQMSRKAPTNDTAAVADVNLSVRQKSKSRNGPLMLRADSPPSSPQQHSYRKRESGARGNNPKPSRIPMRRNSTLLRKAIRRDRDTKAIPPTPPPMRAVRSPPVSVVAARMRQERRKKGHHLPDIPTPPPPVVRSRSPPVPALAKKLAMSQQITPPPPQPQQTPHEVCSRSPPVPALAKKLQEGITWESESGDRGARQEQKTQHRSGPSTTFEYTHEYDDGAKAVPFHISTSVKDSDRGGGRGRGGRGRNDDGEVAHPTLHLPPLTDSNHDPPLLTEPARNLSPSSTHHHPSSLPRQQQIIQELAMLREGILSHKCGLDDRVQRIITRKPCPF